MLRYEGLLTPFAPLGGNRINADAVGDAGQMMAAASAAEQARQDKLAHDAAQLKLQTFEAEGKNRYYDAQAETHRLQIQEAKDSANTKRLAALMDSLRKAKNAVERQQIREAMHQIPGVTTDEVETALPSEAAPPSAPGQEAAVAPPPVTPKGKKGKSPKVPLAPEVDPTFAAALKQDVAANSPMTDESPMGPTLKLLGIPGADPFGGNASGVEASSGEAGMSSAGGDVPAEPAAAPRGGKFVVKKDGVVVHEYDEPLERARSQTQIRAALEASGLAATTPRERAATQAAVESGGHFLDLGLSPNEAVTAARNVYRDTLLGEFKKSPLVGAGGGGGGLSKAEVGRQSTAEIGVNRIMTNENVRNKFSALNAREQEIDNGEALLSQGGFANTSAMLSWLKAMTGRAPQQEFKALQATQSLWGRITQEANKLEEGAPFSDEMKDQMREAFGATRKAIEGHREEIARSAEDEVQNSLIPFKSPEERQGQVRRVGAAMRGKPTSGSKPAGEKSDEELIRDWKAGKQ